MERLHYSECEGHGPPLVVLHGLFGCGRNWRGVAHRLAPRHVVLADLRNHGQSFHAEEMTFVHMADDVENLRKSRNWRRIHLLGHSLGGKVALCYALRHPERAASLALVDIAPKSYHRFQANFQAIIAAMQRLDSPPFPRRGEMIRRLSEALAGDQALAQFLVTSNYTAQGWALNLCAIERALPQLLAWPEHAGLVYRGPALLIRGELSTFVDDEDAVLFPKLLPSFQMEMVRQAGHNVQADQPQALVDALVRLGKQSE